MSQAENVQALYNDSLSLLKQLVAFDSVSRNSNLPIIAFIESYLGGHGFSCTRVPSPDGQKSNLLARIGPLAEGGVVFSGHTDVVPIDGQEWHTDPFTLTEREGKLFGRGTSDMKSFLAVCMALAPCFAGLPLKKPVWFAFSYDEEVGCLGVPYLVEYAVKHCPMPAFCLIGEPTLMQVVTAHKGVVSFETTVTGFEGHSSQPQLGANAVQVACELIHALTGEANVLAQDGMRDERFSPPYSTVHTGIVHGGTARNIIPKECRFQWEIRPLPGEPYEAIVRRHEERCRVLEQKMRAVHPSCGIHNRPMSHMSGVTLPASAQTCCASVMRSAMTNRELAVSFGTEAGVFNDHGIPAIICGPGSIEQAHKPNEFIEPQQIRACVEFILRLAAEPSLLT